MNAGGPCKESKRNAKFTRLTNGVKILINVTVYLLLIYLYFPQKGMLPGLDFYQINAFCFLCQIQFMRLQVSATYRLYRDGIS